MSGATKGILALLVALHAAALGLDLTADPPESLDTSQGIFIDEGWKTYSARNLALFGSVQPREGLTLGWAFRSALPTKIWELSFQAFGVSRLAARLPNLLFSLGTLLLLFAVARRIAGDERAGLLAAALYALDFNATMFARLAFQETQVAFWLALALHLWIRSEERQALGIAAALAALAAAASKATAIPLIAAIWLASAFPIHKGWGRRFFGEALAIAAILLIFLVPLETLGLRLSEAGTAPGEEGSRLSSLHRVALAVDSGYPSKILPTFAAALVGALLILLRGCRSHPGERVAAAWLAAGLAMFAVTDYRPCRYFPVIAPPLILLAASFLSWGPGALRAAWLAAGRLRKAAFLALLAPGAYLAAYAGLKLCPPPKGYIAAAAGLAIALSALLLLFLRRGRAASLQRGTLALILLGAVGFFAIQYGRWASRRTHLLAEAARAVREAVPADATLGGYQAIALAPDLPHFIGDVDNPPGRLPTLSEKLRLVRPSHLVATRENFKALDPDLRARARFLRTLALPGPYRDSGLWRIEGSWERTR